MKNVRFVLSVTVLLGMAGCSTPTPKPTPKTAIISHASDFAIADAIEDGRRFFEMGKIDAAEQKLQSVLAIEPNNRKARYYLTLVQELRVQRERSPKFWGYHPTYPPKPIYQ